MLSHGTPGNQMSRRGFLQSTSQGFVVVTLIAAGCGGDGGNGNPSGCDGLSSNSTPNAGHNHSVCIPRADLNNPPATGGVYTTSSTGHTHLVVLSAADLGAITGGGTVNIDSSFDDGHIHRFSLRV